MRPWQVENYGATIVEVLILINGSANLGLSALDRRDDGGGATAAEQEARWIEAWASAKWKQRRRRNMRMAPVVGSERQLPDPAWRSEESTQERRWDGSNRVEMSRERARKRKNMAAGEEQGIVTGQGRSRGTNHMADGLGKRKEMGQRR